MKKWVELDFEVGQEVYLKTDDEQKRRIITAIMMRPTGISYSLAQGSASEYWAYGFEISEHISIKTKTEN